MPYPRVWHRFRLVPDALCPSLCGPHPLSRPVLQFGLLGIACASAAVALYEGVRISEIALRPLPRWVSAPLAGAMCGIIAYKFPQVIRRKGGEELNRAGENTEKREHLEPGP